MAYNLLQKAARSACITKSTYLLDKMMKARNKANVCKIEYDKRRNLMVHQELNQQETEFLLLSKVNLIFRGAIS